MGLEPTVRDPQVEQHLSQCAACAAFEQDLLGLEQSIEALPDYDVSDEVFAQTLAAVKATEHSTERPSKRLNQQWAAGLAACFVLVAVAGLLYNGSISEYGADFNQVPYASEPNVPRSELSANQSPTSAPADDEYDHFNAAESGAENNAVEAEYRAVKQETAKPSVPTGDLLALEEQVAADHEAGFVDHDSTAVENKIIVSGSRIRRETPQSASEISLGSNLGDQTDDSVSLSVAESQAISQQREKAREHVSRPLDQLLDEVSAQSTRSRRTVIDSKDQAESAQPSKPLAKRKVKPQSQPAEPTTTGFAEKRNKQDLKPQTPARQDLGRDGLRLRSADKAPPKKADTAYYAEPGQSVKDRRTTAGSDAAMAYLSSLQATEGLSFKAASGYWANTYVPGDPNMRWIQSQLLAADGLNLPEVRQNVQPFDPPSQSALAVYLNSDHQALAETGPTRLRLQVGIQAGEQQGGQRAVLHTALVLDLSQTTDQAVIKAMFDALLKVKQSADQVALFVVGQGQILQAADFRHGPIQVAITDMFKQPRNPAMGLSETVQAAHKWLQQHDDPSSALGSSAVWLVTDQTLAATDMQVLESQLHQQALDGLTFSTMSLGAATERKQLQRLAILGQGHSHVLHGANDAQRVINDAIKASSRAVARALRLQIRLAEQVQLIDVLGSYSLNADQAQQVRDAEQSLDQRLARNLGIQADRGADEEGIQMVIPNFYAGDTHVIILDVLVSQPGQVVDVTARYKDLIYLRNAVSRHSLQLPTGHNRLGPLQHNVMKNVLIHHVTDGLTEAGELLRTGHIQAAAARLQSMLALYQAMRRYIPAWHEDAELKQDEQVLKQLLQLIQSQSAIEPHKYHLIADSMSYLSWRKRLTHSP